MFCWIITLDLIWKKNYILIYNQYMWISQFGHFNEQYTVRVCKHDYMKITCFGLFLWILNIIWLSYVWMGGKIWNEIKYKKCQYDVLWIQILFRAMLGWKRVVGFRSSQQWMINKVIDFLAFYNYFDLTSVLQHKMFVSGNFII